MRSLTIVKAALTGVAATFLGGCLISDDPVLNANNGKAAPLAAGAYRSCAVSEGDDPDCQLMIVEKDKSGVFRFTAAGEDEIIELRFRRIARDAYAVQSNEGDSDDGYAYYYGAGNAKKFRLTMMLCADLSDALRDKLMARGDLEKQDEDFTTCKVKTVRGLTEAAKAYHRGQSEGNEDAVIELTPAAAGAGAE